MTKDKKKIKEQNKKYYSSEKGKFNKRKNKLGINMSFYDFKSMKENQNNLCAICKNIETIKNKDLAIDHCHKTNKIRGLLCFKCNRGIGLFNDDIQLLKNAIDYLLK